MNVLIPMAGLGLRFQKNGYELPKHLIEVNGIPMIIRAIRSLELDGKYHFVLGKNKFTESVISLIKTEKPNSSFIVIDYVTEGPAATCLLHKNNINFDEELVIANCDQIMEWNSNLFLHNVRLFDGAVVTYHNDTDKNSYAKINKDGIVLEIKEKEVISNVSLNGIHYWKKGSYFVDSAESMVSEQNRSLNGEYYIGPSYNYLIKKGLKIGIFHIPNQQHHAVGIPDDLEKFVNYEKKSFK